MTLAMEANFDGLIGPTHNYGGLSDGNLASAKNAGLVAYPREAALQGLSKMEEMAKLGLWQGVLPPQQRPHLPTLRMLGYTGRDSEIFDAAWEFDPRLAKNIMSASSMWAANAATVSPSFDTQDGRLHLTPANLSTMLHRAIEHEQTGRALRVAMPFAKVHVALPAHSVFADEGAANHVRLCAARGAQGVEIFVYGRDGFSAGQTDYPARQTRQACEAVARRHGVKSEHTVYALQSQAAINAGAFHNDVVCVGALNVLFYHQLAFENTVQMQADIRKASGGLFDPKFIEVSSEDVPIKDAIDSYLFNSMLVQFPDEDRLTLIAPLETKNNAKTASYCEKLTSGNGPIGQVKYVDVRQSMRNGGGPACLRLRVTMSENEWAQVNPKMVINSQTLPALRDWVTTHYREALAPDDLRDPDFMTECFEALDALTVVLGLGSDFYPFQRH